MSDEVTITIDGKEVKTTSDRMLIQAANEAGVYIPYLCYHPGMKPYGACRMCVVEVEGVSNPVASCTTPAAEGMEVRTSTEAIDEHRKILLELVVSENPQVDVDPLRGYASQELTTLADRYQARSGRFQGAQFARMDDPGRGDVAAGQKRRHLLDVFAAAVA